MNTLRSRMSASLAAATGLLVVGSWLVACAAAGSGEEPVPGVGGSGGASPGDTGVAEGLGGKAGQGGSGGVAGLDSGDAAEAAVGDDSSKPEVSVEAAAEGGSSEAGDAAQESCVSSAEVCDGKDNNCNGQIDDGNPGGGQPCQTGKAGECAAGTTQCTSGQIRCVQNNLPVVEVCDGKDNNCDGNLDEGDPGGGTQCDTGQLGLCKAGIMHCGAGGLVCTAIHTPEVEVCNGFDDDCDGIPDNGTVPGAGVPCSVPGQNANTPCGKSTTVCDTNGTIVCPQVYTAQPETCNGIDDDCNGTIDDAGAVNGQACDTTLPGVCAQGTSWCQSGTLKCNSVINPGDKAEVCNTKDDNCNGQIDEMDPTAACVAQYGQALHVGSWDCVAGACAISTCQPNYFDINKSPTDGCECSLPTFGASCSEATALSVPLDTTPSNPITLTGGIPPGATSAWIAVQFAKPALGTQYHFQISLTDAHGSEYKMNVRTACGEFASCSDGADRGKDATTWEVSATYVLGPGCCSDSPPQPSELFVEVYRTSLDPTCNTFTVTFLNNN